ncbi:MAG TPA: CapA family protein [Tenuifilaceae bacterium]|jgi:poly-gamma-glutamate synthesis protein (capsule biosynthesis protein)|nr:CapA family protein [Tenuifilaceae bacterium]
MMELRKWLLVFSTVFSSIVFAKSQEADSSSLTLLFVGDVMGHSPQISSALNPLTGEYEYDSVFTRMKGVFSMADFTIANLEVTLGGEPYTGYPQFSSPDALVDGLINAGVNVLVTANNHSADRGAKGIQRTVETLDRKGIIHTGTFSDSSDRLKNNPLILEKNGMRIALLNYTYGTNGLPVPAPCIVNKIDTLVIIRDIAMTRLMNADEIVVFIHWGNEYERYPSAAQVAMANFLNRQGVRIVIGSHPHVVQPMEATLDTDSTTGRIVVYSLGNFVSNQRRRYCDGGALAAVKLVKKSTGKSEITAAGFLPVWVHTPSTASHKTFQVLPVSIYETAPKGYFSADELAQLTQFATDTRALMHEKNLNFPELIFYNGSWIIPDNRDKLPSTRLTTGQSHF